MTQAECIRYWAQGTRTCGVGGTTVRVLFRCNYLAHRGPSDRIHYVAGLIARASWFCATYGCLPRCGCSGVDLCEAEFEKLSEGQKVFFRAIQWPEDGSDSDADDGGVCW